MIPFDTWLKLRLVENNDHISDAILGVVAGDGVILDDDTRKYLMGRNTKEFSREILLRLKNLGVIKNLSDDDQNRYGNVIQSIQKGVSVGELINMVRGPNLAPNAEIA